MKPFAQLPGPGSTAVSCAIGLLALTGFRNANALPMQERATYVEVVNQADPGLQWTAPAAISAGTGLGAAQLSATAAVPGTFVYTPGPETVLAPGMQTLSVQFTPVDGNYRSAMGSAALQVTGSQPSFRLDLAQSLPGGDEVILSAVETATVLFTVTPLAGFRPAMSFGCNAPGIVCTFSPRSADLGTTPLAVTLTLHWIKTTSASMQRGRLGKGGLPPLPLDRSIPYEGIPVACAAFIALLRFRRRLPASFQRLALLLIAILALSLLSSSLGCGETVGELMTVTAIAAGESHSLPFAVVIP